jgi:CSLREA domain-containing protein
MKRSTIVGVLVALLLCLGSSARAATITVNTTLDDLTVNGNCSLREAIRSANLDVAKDGCVAGSGADEIILPAGVYGLSLGPAGDDKAVRGDLDLAGVLTITGAGAATTTIDAANVYPDRAFDVQKGSVVSISGVKIVHGFVLTSGGGAIRNRQAVLTLTGCTLFDNSALNAVNNSAGGVTIHGSKGGGILNSGTLTLNPELLT